MNREYVKVVYKNKSNLVYHKFGTGTRYLLAFHGFADSGVLFANLNSLQADYTIIAFDLPFHGETEWLYKEFTPQQIKTNIDAVLEAEKIDRFSMICHSMGGRVVLALSESYVAQLEGLIMLAPAGFQGALSDNKWLFPKFSRKILKSLANYPKLIVTVFKVGRSLGIINKGTFVFLKQMIESEERRNRLFDCWVSLANFPISLKKFHKYLSEQHIPITFFYGETDYITPAKYGKRFIAGLPKANLFMVMDGHYFLREPLNEVLREWLLSTSIQ